MHIFHKWIEKDRQRLYRYMECAICGKRKVIDKTWRNSYGSYGYEPMKYPDWEFNANQSKYSRRKIEEARKRLDTSSRGSDEEYYKNLVKMGYTIIPKTSCSTMTGDLIIDNNFDKKVTLIVIDGVVDARENPISINDFLDKFIDWIESNNWYFGGTSGENFDENE